MAKTSTWPLKLGRSLHCQAGIFALGIIIWEMLERITFIYQAVVVKEDDYIFQFGFWIHSNMFIYTWFIHCLCHPLGTQMDTVYFHHKTPTTANTRPLQQQTNSTESVWLGPRCISCRDPPFCRIATCSCINFTVLATYDIKHFLIGFKVLIVWGCNPKNSLLSVGPIKYNGTYFWIVQFRIAAFLVF